MNRAIFLLLAILKITLVQANATQESVITMLNKIEPELKTTIHKKYFVILNKLEWNHQTGRYFIDLTAASNIAGPSVRKVIVPVVREFLRIMNQQIPLSDIEVRVDFDTEWKNHPLILLEAKLIDGKIKCYIAPDGPVKLMQEETFEEAAYMIDNAPPPLNETLVSKVNRELNKLAKKKYGMHISASGGGWLEDKHLTVHFTAKKFHSIEDTRTALIHLAEEYLRLLNSYEELKASLAGDYTLKNIEITIFNKVEDKDRSTHLVIAEIDRGRLTFLSDPNGRGAYHVLKNETYEEALEILGRNK